jgi:hypothetical protein
MRCPICGDLLDVLHDSTLPAMDGAQVHLSCAEREAHVASRKRTIHAIISGMLVAGALALALVMGIGLRQWLGLVALFLILHILINRRWWHYMVLSPWLWWRLRR